MIVPFPTEWKNKNVPKHQPDTALWASWMIYGKPYGNMMRKHPHSRKRTLFVFREPQSGSDSDIHRTFFRPCPQSQSGLVATGNSVCGLACKAWSWAELFTGKTKHQKLDKILAIYPLVNVDIAMVYMNHHFIAGKPTISLTIFNSKLFIITRV